MRFAICLIAALVSSAVELVPPLAASVQGPVTSLSAEVDQVLWWLPSDTETVMVAHGRTRARSESMPMSAGAVFEDEASLDFSGWSYAEAMSQSMRGASVKLYVTGARSFSPPKRLGSALFEGCEVFLLTRAHEITNATLVASLAKSGAKVETIEEAGVAVFREQREHDIWTSYIVMPRPEVLLVATNREYLAEMLRRMKVRGERRALPANLAEWEYVDQNAPFWGMRHYDRSRAEFDPTSPFGGEKAANQPDEEAIGIVYFSHSKESVTVRYLSTNPKAEQLQRETWTDQEGGLAPTVRRIAPTVIETRATPKDEDALATFFFVLFAALGHVVYL